KEQADWLEDVLARLDEIPAENEDTSYICLMDTGVNRGHPLLEPALGTDDTHTIEPAWGTDDEEGHGTQMAGLSLFGNLTHLLDGSDSIRLYHRLESVKLLNKEGGNTTDAELHGYLTAQAV